MPKTEKNKLDMLNVGIVGCCPHRSDITEHLRLSDLVASDHRGVIPASLLH